MSHSHRGSLLIGTSIMCICASFCATNRLSTGSLSSLVRNGRACHSNKLKWMPQHSLIYLNWMKQVAWMWKTNEKAFGQKASYTDTCLAKAFNDPNLYRALMFQSQIPRSFLVMSFQIIGLSQRFCITFYNMLIIYGKELLATQITPLARCYPCLVHNCLITTPIATLHTREPSPPSAG